MPDNTLFRKEASDKINTPAQMDRYIRATRPHVWLLLGALLVMTFALILWGCLGEMRISINTYCITINEKTMTWVKPEDLNSLYTGMAAETARHIGEVTDIDLNPSHYSDIRTILGSDVSEFDVDPTRIYYRVSLDIPGQPDGIDKVEMIEKYVRPIELLLDDHDIFADPIPGSGMDAADADKAAQADERDAEHE